MPTQSSFQLSTYLTLGLACLCLGYSEWEYLPEVTVFTAVVIVLLGVSFWAEGRYELSIPQANRLGLVIGLLAALWVGWQIVRPTGGLVYSLPWPTSLLPYLGPLLMVLIPAKLFRPKQVDDWWAMQGIGLVAVALAVAMSDHGIFGFLLAIYGLVGVWNLTQFFYLRASGGVIESITGAPSRAVVLHVAGNVSWARLLRRSLAWAGMAAAVALPLFFLTPRTTGERWKFGTVVMETGFAANQMIDLNHTGELQANPEVAFEVKAYYPDGSPKRDLDPDTHWRGVGFREYENGRWSQSGSLGLVLFTSRGMARWSAPPVPPDFGPGQYLLDYEPQSLEYPVLAQPIYWSNRQSSPIITIATGKTWYQSPDAIFSYSPSADGKVYPYRQYCSSAASAELSPPNELLDANIRLRIEGPPIGWDAVRYQISEVDLPKLSSWTQTVFQELLRNGRIPAEVADRQHDDPRTLRTLVAPEDYAVVARAFREYFAESPQFRYDVKLDVQNRGIDPIEDFVLHTHAGHCERFATALALCLRSLGIPTVFVLGFRGCEQIEPGRYVVRQENAHAWVEALVPGPVAGTDFVHVERPPPPAQVWHWLTLDPTPDNSVSVENEPTPTNWLQNVQTTWTRFFSDFIVDYNLKRRTWFVQAVVTHFRDSGALYVLALAALAAGRWGFRVYRRTRRDAQSTRPGVAIDWYDDYLKILAATGCTLPPNLTPMEQARVVQEQWHSTPETRGLAVWPIRLTELYYRVRYGRLPLSAAEQVEIADGILQLRRYRFPPRSASS